MQLGLKLYEWINIIALVYFILAKRKNKEYTSFGIFLVFVVLGESVLPLYLDKGSPERILFISLYASLCVFYYQYFYLRLLRGRPYYNIYKWVFISYFIYRLIDYAVIYENGYRSLQYMIGMLFVFFLFFTYAYYVIMKDPFKPLSEYPGLWMGLGVILFFVAVFPLVIFLDFLVFNGLYNKPYFILMHLGNILLSLGYFMMVRFIPVQQEPAVQMPVTSDE